MSHILLPVRLCIQTLDVYCPTSKLPQCSLAAAYVMEERKRTASFSFGWTWVNSLLLSKPTQVVSSFHDVSLPWNRRTLNSLHPAEKTNAALPTDCKGGRQGEKFCGFPASPSPQLCVPARCKVTLSSYMCGLKDYKPESGWSLFFLLLYTELLLAFLGAPSIDWQATNRSEEMERLFTCQPQSSGCVVSPAAVDDTLTP